jgi:hypothetical protein
MSDRDVDAEFADIIARWDEVESLPDAPESRVSGTGGDTGQDTGQDAGSDTLAGSERPDGSSRDDSSPDGSGPRATGVNPSLQPRINPPPNRPFVVWRGAEQPGPAEAEQAPDPVELRGLQDEDDDEHFEPGPTAPLPPQEDLQFWGIIVGLVAGPLILLWLVLFRPNVSDWWTLGALGLTVMGFVLLVMRQPHDRTEDDPDNGARV